MTSTVTIDPDDRVTYAGAIAITGLSHSYLAREARLGRLSRVGGGTRDIYATWLSRTEVEALALARYRRGRHTSYWVTMTEAAKLLRMGRGAAHKARIEQRLPAQQTALGDWLVRRRDVDLLIAAKAFRGRQ